MRIVRDQIYKQFAQVFQLYGPVGRMQFNVFEKHTKCKLFPN